MASITTSNEFGDNVHVSVHPIIAHKITILRSSQTHCGTFRAVLKELTYHLGYEATTNLTTKPVDISVPTAVPDEHIDWKGSKLVERVALIPIMRSGLGMVDSMLELLPNAQVHHIGMYKAHGQERPVQYYNRLPRKCQSDVAYVVDAVVATSSTIMSVVSILKKVRQY
jgi:uracil phosphoribosyltransferase